MAPNVQKNFNDMKEQMQKALHHLDLEFQKIRASKASPQMLDGIKVECYGSMMPIAQVANISTPDPKTIMVQAWDKTLMKTIEKAILTANLGFNPTNDGELIRILVPPLTEERRKDLVKRAKTEAENARVSIRNIRRTANDNAKSFQKEGVPEDEVKKHEKDIQDTTNDFIKKVDQILESKEKEILTV